MREISSPGYAGLFFVCAKRRGCVADAAAIQSPAGNSSARRAACHTSRLSASETEGGSLLGLRLRSTPALAIP
ncbi:hypothetical protein, partial [Pandoraea cepalis]|uniref:hypothetical protein n=1 Tax=Pandoraea cepalis TaxID=2508294 RepID=UPI00263A59F0